MQIQTGNGKDFSAGGCLTTEKESECLYNEKDGGRVIELTEEHKCPFLNENKLCKLVTAYGENVLSETCAVFPREVHRFETHEEETLMPCCPAVIDLLWEEEPQRIYAGKPHAFISGKS